MMAVGVIGYAVCAVAFLVLLLMLLVSWRDRRSGMLLVAAVVSTVAWAGTASYQAVQSEVPSPWFVMTELLRTTTWLAFLFKLVDGMREQVEARISLPRLLMLSAYAMAVLLFAMLVYSMSGNDIAPVFGLDSFVFASLFFSIAGLAFIEQIVRNTATDQRWQIKHLCLALGLVFAFDLYLYSDALLLHQVDAQIWNARGYINTLAMPLLVVASARNQDWSFPVHVSRKMVFHTATLIGAGLYLLAMALGGYYIKLRGGEWGLVAQLVFLFAAIALLAALLTSGRMRARLKVFLHKHFFAYKYDYREEWLRYIQTLSEDSTSGGTRERVIRATADIVESPAGLLWLRDASGEYRPRAAWNISLPDRFTDQENASLVRFLERKRWVVDVDEHAANRAHYDDLVLPEWLRALPEAWLVVPLLQHAQLYGFLVLMRSRAPMQINWEDRDLLLTTGRQASSYLALVDANEALFTARQFEAFNRLSAFVVHDLKNLVAQLSLVVSNAGKHRNNPAFIDDVLHTVENAVVKMNRLLAQLRKDKQDGSALLKVDLAGVLRDAVAHCSAQQPTPQFNHASSELFVVANRDRLTAVFEHLIQNAQDATPANGFVRVRLHSEGAQALVEIEDNGHGMDAQFVRERLFQPFVTTKGNAGMGIGAYESREVVQALGGTVHVNSTPGQGTAFHIRLPLAISAEGRQALT